MAQRHVKNVVIVTDVPFWRETAGSWQRILALAKYLSARTRLRIAFLESRTRADEQRLAALGLPVKLDVIGRGSLDAEGKKAFSEKFRKYMAINTFDACIIEYIRLAFLLAAVPRHTKAMLDTIDIISKRNEGFEKMGLQDTDRVSWQDELRIFNAFDRVLFIQRREHEQIQPLIGRRRAVLVPHPAKFTKREIRPRVASIGYVAGRYAPNLDAIKWFVEHVWNSSGLTEASLDVFGSICEVLKLADNSGVTLHGIVDDLDEIYRRIDIVINPVRVGSGLKIKNVEALANGLPLVTTSHGAEGMEDGAGTAFLVADTPQDFAEHINQLLASQETRQALGEQAYAYAEENFSEDGCFQELMAELA